jgi:HEAT repeat protein
MTLLAAFLLLVAVDDQEAAEALSRFNTAFKAKEPAVRVAAVAGLARIQHEKIHSKLGALLLSDVNPVRIAAARGLGGAQENRKKVTAYLVNGFLANAAERSVEVAIIEALDNLQNGLGRDTLEGHFKGPDFRAAETAIDTAAQLKRKDLLGALIAFYSWMDAQAKAYQSAGPRAKGFVGGFSGDPGPSLDSNASKRLKALGPVVDKTLSTLTLQRFSTPQEWEDWWRRNEATFRFP